MSKVAQHSWNARFVGPPADGGAGGPAPLLRREFDVRGDVVAARVRVSALGVYELYINGTTVGDEVLAPGWTSYSHRLLYRTFEVASLLGAGPNVIAAVLGDGWYRGRLGFHGGRSHIYGDRLGLIAELEIRYGDGSVELVGTDPSWRCSSGPIHASSLYDGEVYDARAEHRGWSAPGFDARSWRPAEPLAVDLDVLTEQLGPPVRRIEEVEPVAVTTVPSGRTLIDFGQNLVGRLRIRVNGSSGDVLTIRHAEVLEGDGELCTRPLRGAAATDRYTLRGGGVEVWEPRFTVHGFRYAELDGWPGRLAPQDVRAIVCHSDMERIGWFECSEPLLEQLHENAIWSMRGNFLSLPTDCPQRDERMAWTGDVQVFCPAATFLYDVRGFLGSWLLDLVAEQAPSGTVPHVVPDILPLLPDVPFGGTGAAGWGDAAVVVPWVLYERYGDATILERQYDSMRAWVDYVAGRAGAKRAWTGDFQFGDWLDPTAPPDHPSLGITDPDLVATAHFARSARLLGLTGGVLGRGDDAHRYLTLADEVEQAFRHFYLAPDGLLTSDSQTAYCLALEFDLLSDAAARRTAAARLASLVRERGHRIATGFLGTPLICDALAKHGYVEDAYALLLQRECPSWLYQVTQGATTIWERWDSLLPDGSVNPGNMTSFNHFAFGAIIDWLHRSVAGLAPGAPGYEKLLIRPLLGGGLTSAAARHHTPRGLAESSWRIEDDVFELTAEVPPGTSASVFLPDSSLPVRVGEGRHTWTVAIGGESARERRGESLRT
jgi:alpha-L-rhamnosidase